MGHFVLNSFNRSIDLLWIIQRSNGRQRKTAKSREPIACAYSIHPLYVTIFQSGPVPSGVTIWNLDNQNHVDPIQATHGNGLLSHTQISKESKPMNKMPIASSHNSKLLKIIIIPFQLRNFIASSFAWN